MSANESAAANGIRTITSAEITYQTAYPLAAITPDVDRFIWTEPVRGVGCIGMFDRDNNLATATAPPGKSGYTYLVNTVVGNFVAAARPVQVAVSGTKTLCAVNDSVIRFDPNGAVVNTVNACLALPGMQ